MAYTVASGAILEVSFRGRYLAQRTISLFHYRYNSTSAPRDGRTFIDVIDPLINANVAGKLLKGYLLAVLGSFTLEEVVYQWIHPTRRARVVKSPAAANGEVIDDPSPPNIACTLTKRSDLPGRKGHGSLHMPACGKGAWDGGEFNLLGLSVYGNLMDRMKETIVVEFGQELEPIILNRTTPTDSAGILNMNSERTVRTMHRRTVGVGE